MKYNIVPVHALNLKHFPFPLESVLECSKGNIGTGCLSVERGVVSWDFDHGVSLGYFRSEVLTSTCSCNASGDRRSEKLTPI